MRQFCLRSQLSSFKAPRWLVSRWLLMPFASLLLVAVPAPEATSSSSAPITRLILRDYEVVISSGANGLTQYDVYSASGEAMNVGLTSAQLQAAYPAVYDSLRPAVAAGDSGLGPMMLLWPALD